ncbi:hypothetical protein Hanom_Chr07g00656451 [Helianthus anomalus]
MGEDHASEVDRNNNGNLDGLGSQSSDETLGSNENIANNPENHVSEINTHIDSQDDQSPSNGNRRSRRKGFRRKGGRQSVHSSAGQERPKKRARSETDPFDIDRFIGILSVGHSNVGNREEVEGSPNNFWTPDLNKHCVHDELGNTGVAVSAADITISSDTNVDQVTGNRSEYVDKEVIETVHAST